MVQDKEKHPIAYFAGPLLQFHFKWVQEGEYRKMGFIVNPERKQDNTPEKPQK